MSLSPEWYLRQAGLTRDRADECRRLALQLDGASLFDLHQYSGESTWQCPAATEFDQQLQRHCGALLAAIDELRANALGLDNEADGFERRAACLFEQRRLAEG